jgi:type IV pilus assembly protein PilM
VILGVSGLHSLTRPANLPLLPKSMLAEAVAREARRVLPVPLDQLYLAWTTIPGPKNRISVYLAATPRKSIDSIMRALKFGGLEVSRMSIKPLTLTKAIPTNNAILIDLQPTEFDLAIMVQGISQPVRSVSLPSEELTYEQKLKMILSDLERTIKFYDTNNPEKHLDSKVPIYVSGELTGKPEYHQIIAEATEHPVLAILPAFKGLEQVDPGRYMVNITMVLSTPSAGREVTFPVANLNMLPAFYQPKPISMAKIVGIPGSAAMAALVIPTLMTMQSTSSNINNLKDQLNGVNQMVVQKTAQRVQINKDIKALEKTSAGAQLAVTNLSASLNAIISGQEIINGDLLLSLSKLSEGIDLKSINETSERLVINGVAATTSDIQDYVTTILTYARDLDISERFSESIVSSMRITTPAASDNVTAEPIDESGLIEFTLTFTREK